MRRRSLISEPVLKGFQVPLVTSTQMQALDRRTIDEANISGRTLMERAGQGVVQTLEKEFGSPTRKSVTIFCGKGNNGGDGLVIARLLKQRQAKIQVVLLADPHELSNDAQHMYRRLLKVISPSLIDCKPSKKIIQDRAMKAQILIDALLGTGMSSTIREPFGIAINFMNAMRAPTIAVDIPSGIHSDTGAVLGCAVNARFTVTFGCPKLGLYVGEGIDHAGVITTVDIGIPRAYVEQIQSPYHLLTPDVIAPILPDRLQSSHKGTCGHVGLIAGSTGKTGSAALAARASLRAGAGLVTIATPRSAQSSLDSKLFEPMTLAMPETRAHTLSRAAFKPLVDFANERETIALGPGITTHVTTAQLVKRLLPCLEHHCVIDADGLNILAGHLSLLSSCKKIPILTPHPGEMARLMNRTTPRTINNDRLGSALTFAQTHNVILVLKGARTIIAAPDGQAAICTTGNPGMASAGMGDVLTGVIASFLAQGLTPWDAARAGVCLHGLAGDLAADKLGQAGLIASDVIEHLPHAIRYARSRL